MFRTRIYCILNSMRQAVVWMFEHLIVIWHLIPAFSPQHWSEFNTRYMYYIKLGIFCFFCFLFVLFFTFFGGILFKGNICKVMTILNGWNKGLKKTQYFVYQCIGSSRRSDHTEFSEVNITSPCLLYLYTLAWCFLCLKGLNRLILALILGHVTKKLNLLAVKSSPVMTH